LSLDYTNGCVNFRDVGEWVNLIAGNKLLKEKNLLRGGKLLHITDASEISFAKSIVNLRRGEDVGLGFLNTELHHFPLPSGYERGHTHLPIVKKWLTDVIYAVAYEINDLPVLFHCTSGKDRTGIVIGVLLHIMNIPMEIIIEEYLLSDGEVDKNELFFALENIKEPERYFKNIELNLINEKFREG
jgi:protein-tyrosine phosphatase